MKNITYRLPAHEGLWFIPAMNAFVSAYPTSIRGTKDNQRGSPGTR